MIKNKNEKKKDNKKEEPIKEKRKQKTKENKKEKTKENRSEKTKERKFIKIGQKKEKKPKKTNREIVFITYIFVGLFVLLMGNMTYFLIAESETVINNSANKRQDLLAERVVRGKILGNNGEVLAETVVDSKGKDKRVYPYECVFSHVVGRFLKGKTGLEESQNFTMLTSNDNPLKKIYNDFSGIRNLGDNLITTLDVDLQVTAHDALGTKKGAIVAIDPSNGKILAMISKPDYDPNQISDNWESLLEDTDNKSTLLNRATQGSYPPGSTFKILTALEYIRENKNYKKYSYTCKGKEVYDGVVVHCYNDHRHGTQNLEQAFANSCNSAFVNLGMKLNYKSFTALCESFLFNKSLPTTLNHRISSFPKNAENDELPQTMIGQGKILTTPLHNAMITAAIANGGTLMKPYILDQISDCNGNRVKKFMPAAYDTLMTPKEAEVLTNYMESVVEEGTGRGLQGLGISIAGKTGSAEFTEDKTSHSWFVGFAPADDPKIVVSVIVEGAGTGSEAAVPVARKMFQNFLLK